jgi:hypothetical protein
VANHQSWAAECAAAPEYAGGPGLSRPYAEGELAGDAGAVECKVFAMKDGRYDMWRNSQYHHQ